MDKRILLPLLLLAVSCSQAPDWSSSREYDPVKPTVHRNGDLLGLEEASSYAEVTVAGDVASIEKKIEQGDSLFLLNTQANCSHCLDFLPTFVSYALASHTQVYSLEGASAINAVTSKLKEDYPAFAPELEELYTPQLFLIHSESEIEEIPLSMNLRNPNRFQSQMADLYNNAEVYEFADYSHFSSYVEEHLCLAFKDDGSNEAQTFYKDHLREPSKIADGNHPLAILNYSSLSSEDKVACDDETGTGLWLMKKEENEKTIVQDHEAMVVLAEGYYGISDSIS